MIFGPKLYLFNMKCKLPNGQKTIKITGFGFDDFAREAFMAGVRFGQEHPDLQIKGDDPDSERRG